ncbi:hypothetical protein BG000_007563 [Podila horticola]|nr:hypothetical protein BG000_007563 [Podila horticola]
MVNFSGSDIFLFIIGFFLPPLVSTYFSPLVTLGSRFSDKKAWTAWASRTTNIDTSHSIGLTLLGHIPGIGYAWYTIYTYRDDPDTHRRHSNGRAYVAIPQQPPNYQTTAPAPPPHPVV